MTMAFLLVVGGGLLLLSGTRNRPITDILQGITDPIPTNDPATTPAAQQAGTFVGQGLGGTNPLPGWRKGRIDQGVDFSAPKGKPIYSPGSGKVLRNKSVWGPRYPKGVLIQLDNGQIWYIYEGIDVNVKPGQRVQAGQQVGTSDGTSIEIGLADRSGQALAHSVYHEGAVTAWGRKANALLTAMGVR